MGTFTLICTDKPGALPLRLQTRPAHLDYIDAHIAMIKVAGPLLDAAGDPAGSLFVVEAETIEDVQAFAAADPYALAGVFEKAEIKAFRIVRGGF